LSLIISPEGVDCKLLILTCRPRSRYPLWRSWSSSQAL